MENITLTGVNKIQINANIFEIRIFSGNLKDKYWSQDSPNCCVFAKNISPFDNMDEEIKEPREQYTDFRELD